MSTKISVEISMYPLGRDPIPPISDFIERLNRYPELAVDTNAMSTRISGPHDRVFDILKEEIRQAHEVDGRAVFVMKVLGGE